MEFDFSPVTGHMVELAVVDALQGCCTAHCVVPFTHAVSSRVAHPPVGAVAGCVMFTLPLVCCRPLPTADTPGDLRGVGVRGEQAGERAGRGGTGQQWKHQSCAAFLPVQQPTMLGQHPKLPLKPVHR